MGARGPKPKPTIIKIMQGNPGKRPLNLNEPKFAIDGLRCPTFLDNVAKREWRRIFPELLRLHLVTVADRAALAAYCQAYSDFRKASLNIQERGDVYVLKDDDGKVRYIQQSPYVAIKNNAISQMIKIAQQFGFTPSSRSSLKVENDSGNQGQDTTVARIIGF